MENENTMKAGTIYKSAVSGLWYQNKNAAGDICAVRIDGITFSPKGDTPNKYTELKHCAMDLDECTVTIAFDDEAQVIDFLDNHESRSRVKLVEE